MSPDGPEEWAVMSLDETPAPLAIQVADGWRTLPAERVQAVHPATALVELPGAPGWLRGLAWREDAPLGVIDLAALEGQGLTAIHLLVRLRDTGLALAATAVHAAARLDAPATPVAVDGLVERVTAALTGER